MSSPSLYIVDASAMFFRAYYAIRPLTSKSGVPTNSIYGYLSMMVKLLKDIKPDYIAICYDLPGPSFRKEISEQYKANRSETPEDLQQQFPYLKKLTELLGLPAFEREGFEADDLIGSLVDYGKSQDWDVVIVSGDKDFAQLIGPQVSMLDTMKNVKYTPEKVFEKWGVHPEQFIDYLSIVGDSSDNVSGVKGIGPKGAQKLLQEYQSLDGIYENIDSIKGANQKKLIEFKQEAYLSKKLVTIVRDLQVVDSIDALKRATPDNAELRSLLQELSIATFEKSLLGPVEESAESAATNVEVASELRKFSEIEVDADTVTKHFKPESEVHLLTSDSGIYLANSSKVAKLTGELKSFQKVFDKSHYKFTGYDLKTTWHMIDLHNPKAHWDHMLAAYIVEARDPKGLNQVLERFQLTELPEIPTPTQLAAASFALQEHLEAEIDRVGGEGVLRGLDLPLIPILYQMEKRGIRVDTGILSEQSAELAEDIVRLEKEIHELAGEEFNVASPKQLGAILFEKLGLKTKKKTKTGFSTDNDVLMKLASSHPICEKVIEFRELSKLKSTYVDALPSLVDEQSRIHTNLRQAHTATGRLSSINPNLQNIPIRTERGALIRRAFIPAEGMQLASVDYSQIELRILAHYAGDQGLQTAFEKNQDIHSATAAEIFATDFEDVTSEQRRLAKAVNFGIAYGQGPFGLAEALSISRTEAKEIINRYFEKFPGVKGYMESIVEDAKSSGFVETLFGRRRYLQELKSKNPAMKKFGERAAINAPIQGTAADLVKKAMIEAAKIDDLHMILQIHDELLFEAEPKQMEEKLPKACAIMESITNLSVPLKVNAHTGKNWDEAH